MSMPPLPEGFVLQDAGPPPRHPGFVFENPSAQQAEEEAAAMPVQNPNRFRSRVAKPQLSAPDLSTEGMRQALEPAPNTVYGSVLPLGRRLDEAGQPVGGPFLTMPGMIRSPLLGLLDIGQGRYQTDETGTRILPTENTLAALMGAAGVSPAYRGSLVPRARQQEAAATPEPPIAPEAPMARAPEPVPPVAQQVEAPRPAPQSVGAAATPEAQAAMSAPETLAARTQAELRDIFTPPRPGDATEYVPGVGLTRAELELSPSASREAKVLRMQAPERFAELDRQRADAYASYFDNLAGSETLLNRARMEREAQGMPILNRVFANAKNAWPQPIVDKIDDILSSAQGKRSLVASELKGIRSRVVNDDGTLESNPALLYGVRQHINDKLSKDAKILTPLIKLAEKDMIEVQGVIDEVIEQAAPGFRIFLEFWNQASRPIDVMEELLAARTQLFKGSDRRVAFHDFDRVMKGWALERGAPGANPAKSFTDEQWQQLMGMWRSLQRTAEEQRLARTPGSDTTQTFYDLGKAALKGVGHTAGVVTMNPLVNIATHVGGRTFDDWQKNRSLNRMFNVEAKPPPAD